MPKRISCSAIKVERSLKEMLRDEMEGRIPESSTWDDVMIYIIGLLQRTPH